MTFLLGMLLGNYFSLYRDRRKEFNEAAMEFRRFFANEIRQIKDQKHIDLEDFLTADYQDHVQALDQFLQFFTHRDKTKIIKAWNKHCWNDERGKIRPNQIMFAHYTYLDNEEDRVDCRQLALDNIERLIFFATLK